MKTTWIKYPNFENFGVWVLLILAGVSPTKQMRKALVEWTMPMDTSIWARNLSSDPFYLAIASKSNIVDNKY